MARPREFDRDEVLDRALGVFWDRGYESTSIDDLVGAMGIGRASLYNTFGSKHDLFVEALDRYERSLDERLLRPLAAPGSPRTILRAVLDDLAACQCGPEARGCLAVKAALVTCRGDCTLQERVARITRRIDDAFLAVLHRARDAGEVRADADLPALARFLTHSMQALSVSGPTRRDERQLREIVKVTLSVLDPA